MSTTFGAAVPEVLLNRETASLPGEPFCELVSDGGCLSPQLADVFPNPAFGLIESKMSVRGTYPVTGLSDCGFKTNSHGTEILEGIPSPTVAVRM